VVARQTARQEWMHPKILAVIPSALSLLTNATALAAERRDAQDASDTLTTNLTLEFQIDVGADDVTDTFGKAETASELRLSPNLSFELGLVFESLAPGTADREHIFDGHGLIVEQAFLSYSRDAVDIFAGKFNPSFGFAWSEMPGIYGDGFAKDYEFVEALGAGVRFRLGEGGFDGHPLPGQHDVTMAVYRSDTTPASGSLFYSRGRARLSDGGAANTEGLSSVAVAWEGKDLSPFDLDYNIGLSYRAGGRGASHDEFALVAGVLGSEALSRDLDLRVVAEMAHFWNAEAQRQDRRNTSLGATFTFDEAWHIVVAYAGRTVIPHNGSATTDHLLEVSGGYRFESGLGLDLGYAARRSEAVWTGRAGLLVSWSADF
jgi:hypothetical protein